MFFVVLAALRAELLASRFSGTTARLADQAYSDLTTTGVWGGGALHLEPSPQEAAYHSSCTVESCIFINDWTGSSATSILGGGAIYANFVELTCTKCNFTMCKAMKGKGGAIYSHNMSVTVLRECDFKQCTADSDEEPGGGAVYVHEDRLDMEWCFFTECSTRGNGGAVLVNKELHSTHCQFTATNATEDGGAIYASGAECVVYQNIFNGCSCEGKAGAVYYNGTEVFNVSADIVNCYASGDTNCLYISGASSFVFEFVDIDFSQQTTSVSPFVRLDTYSGDLILRSCTVNGHECQFDGNDLWIVFPTTYQSLTVSGCHFEGLTRSDGGGCFRFPAGQTQEVSFIDCEFVKNKARANGGAIAFASNQNLHTASITNCIFRDCVSGNGDTTYKFGGAIYFGYGTGSCSIVGCTFDNNGNSDHSGGQSIEIDCTQNSPFAGRTVSNCTFKNHKGGYPLYVRWDNDGSLPEECVLSECTFEQNTVTESYGLVYAWTSQTVRYDRCRFIENTPSGPAGVVAMFSGKGIVSSCKFDECTFSSSSGVSTLVFCNQNYATEVSFTGCDFVECVVTNGVLVYTQQKNNVQSVTFSSCVFDECTSGTSACVLSIQNNRAVSVERCNFTNCQGNDGLVLSISTGTLSFEFNNFTLSLENTGPAVSLGLSNINSPLEIRNCSFSNDGKNVRDRFISLLGTEVTYQSVTFSGCVFSDISAPSGAGIYVNLERGGTLTATECQFANLVCQGDGAAINTWHTNVIEIDSCIFDSCHAGGSAGGVYVTDWTQSGSIRNCRFTASLASGQAQSVHLVLASGYKWDRIDIEGNVFEQHTKGVIVFFGRQDSSWCESDEVKLTRCHFLDNELEDGEEGVFFVRSNNGLKYDGCSFKRNRRSSGIVSMCDWSSAESCTFADCVFEANEVSNGGVMFLPSTSTIETLVLSGCTFSSWTGRIVSLTSSLPTFTAQSCHFEGWTGRTDQQGMLVVGTNNKLACPTVTFTDCDFASCDSGGDAICVLDIIADTLTLQMNNFSLSVERQYAISIEQNDKSKELLIDQCNFSNNDYKVGQSFFKINQAHTDVQFSQCVFENIASATGGGAIKLALTTGAVLSIDLCQFRYCSCANDGGAIHGQTTPEINVRKCVFEHCSCNSSYANPVNGGGGAVHLQTDTTQGVIENCTFISNKSPIHGQSVNIQFNGDRGYDRITMTDCTFSSHDVGSVLAFVWTGTGTFGGDYLLSYLIFSNNAVRDEESHLSFLGLVNANSTGSITYKNCSFFSNYMYVSNRESGLLVLGSENAPAPRYTFEKCIFRDCSSNTDGGVFFNPRGRNFGSLHIEACGFDRCAGALVRIYSVAESILINSSYFDQCSSSPNPSILAMQTTESEYTQSLEITGCQFIKCGAYYPGGSMDTTILDICAHEATIDSCDFDAGREVSHMGNVIPISASVREGWSLTFNMCTFTTLNMQVVHFIRVNTLDSSTSGQAQVTLSGCEFHDILGFWNSPGEGIGLSLEYPGTLTVRDCNFTDISSYRDTNQGAGAAIASSSLKKIELSLTTFERCAAYTPSSQGQYLGGGAIYLDSSESVEMDECNFVNNTCTNQGQCFALTSVSTVYLWFRVSKCNFTGHSTRYSLISMKVRESTDEGFFTESVKFVNCTFNDNSLSSSTGVLSIKGTNVGFEGCYFLNNDKFDETEGASIVSITHCLSASEFSIVDCQFVNCHQESSNGGIIVCPELSDYGRTVNIQKCSFSQCTGQYSTIAILKGRLTTLDISSNVFEDCKSTASSAILFISKPESGTLVYVENLLFEENDCSGCSGASDANLGSVLTLICKYPTFSGNNFSLSLESNYGLFFDFSKLERDLDISNCKFDNNNKYLEYGAELLRFSIGFSSRPITVSECVFENIQTWAQGPAIRVSIDGYGGNPAESLVLTGCEFKNLLAQSQGGAVYCGYVKTLTVTACTFTGCQTTSGSFASDGGGGLYVSYKVESATIRDCVFVDNQASMNGKSLQIVSQVGKTQTSEIVNCSFEGHTKTSGTPVLAIARVNQGGSTTEPLAEEVRLTSCNFTGNNLAADLGLAKIDSSVGYVYDNCRFIRNENPTRSLIVLPLHETSQHCRFISCEFEGTTSEQQVATLISVSGLTVPVPEFELTSCTFTGIQTTSGILPSVSGAQTLAGSPLSAKMTVSGCNFTSCTAVSGSVLTLNSNEVALTENDFHMDHGSASPISLQVNSGKSTIEHVLFDVVAAASVQKSLIDLVCGEGAEVDFYNCCFVHTGDVASGASTFLTVSNNGIVKFSVVCFDTDMDSALTVFGNEITYDGDPKDFFFGHCYCWGMTDWTIYPDPESSSVEPSEVPPEPSSSSGLPPEPSSSSGLPPEPSSSSSGLPPEPSSSGVAPTEDPDPESGSGGKSNAGLVAGLVVMFIVIIAVVVVVVIFLLRRRRGSAPSDEGVTGAQEFAEETVSTTANETHGGLAEWSQTSEDNPVFMAESYDEGNPFANAFEEHNPDFFGQE